MTFPAGTRLGPYEILAPIAGPSVSVVARGASSPVWSLVEWHRQIFLSNDGDHLNDFVSKSGGAVGPHTHYALPGRMLIAALSNDKDHGGRTALVEYSNKGDYLATHWIPTDEKPGGAKVDKLADGYGYVVRVLPRQNAMLTSSFTGWNNYMMDFGKMMQDKEAMKRFGQTVMVWDLHVRKPKKVLQARVLRWRSVSSCSRNTITPSLSSP